MEAPSDAMAARVKRKPSTSSSKAPTASPRILTVGHSTRTIEEFMRLLEAHGVKQVADVRTIPRSRHNPQFNANFLPKALKKAGIGYIHLAGLGGLRHAGRASVNTGWRNAPFRGFADYMQTPEFEEALEDLIKIAKQRPLALMCAEAVPWRCHRSLIADALLVRGVPVEHILSATKCKPHTLTPFAKVQGTRISYPLPGIQAPQPHGARRPTPLRPSDRRPSKGHIKEEN